MRISTFGPSFVTLLLHSFFFVMFSCLLYFTPKYFSFSSTWLVVCFCVISPPFVDRIFFCCFGTFDATFLIFLLSPVLSGLFPQVVWLFFPVLTFSFCLFIFQRLFFVLSFCPVFRDFFYLRFQLLDFHRSLSENKCPFVSRTPLTVLDDLANAVL